MRAVLLLVLCLALSGCRVRTGNSTPTAQDRQDGETESFPVSGSLPEDGTQTDGETEEQEKNGESGGQTKENPEASRREYDETRPAEILPGTEKTVHDGGEGPGAFAPGDESDRTVAKLNSEAEQTAARIIPADEAEQKGVSDDAAEADSAMTYYFVLLQDRTGTLFECQRQNVYWETAKDHITVFKKSPEHSLILDAGAYDVSSRLLEENLHVDDGWIARKNPGVIVKTVDRSVLGTGVVSAGAARSVCTALLARDGWETMDAVRNRRVLILSEELLEAPHLKAAASLIIAKTAYPDLFSDVDPEKALEMLCEEAAGSVPNGVYYYAQGGL